MVKRRGINMGATMRQYIALFLLPVGLKRQMLACVKLCVHTVRECWQELCGVKLQFPRTHNATHTQTDRQTDTDTE